MKLAKKNQKEKKEVGNMDDMCYDVQERLTALLRIDEYYDLILKEHQKLQKLAQSKGYKAPSFYDLATLMAMFVPSNNRILSAEIYQNIKGLQNAVKITRNKPNYESPFVYVKTCCDMLSEIQYLTRALENLPTKNKLLGVEEQGNEEQR